MARRRKTPQPSTFVVPHELVADIIEASQAETTRERKARLLAEKAASSSSASSSSDVAQPPEKQARLEQHAAGGGDSMCGASDASAASSDTLLEDRMREQHQQHQREMAAMEAKLADVRTQLAAALDGQAALVARMDSLQRQLMQHVTDTHQAAMQQMRELAQKPMQPQGCAALPAPAPHADTAQPAMQRLPAAAPRQQQAASPQQQPSTPSAPPPRQQGQPGPHQPPPPASFKEAVGGAPADRPMPDAAKRRARPPSPCAPGLADRAQELRFFVLKGRAVPELIKAGPGATLDRLAAFLAERLPTDQPLAVVDAVRRGPNAAPCIFFEVATLAQADSLIQHRCALRGSGTTIFEALSADERRQQTALWPAFLAARDAGKRAQFKRAALFVDGQRVRVEAA